MPDRVLVTLRSVEQEEDTDPRVTATFATIDKAQARRLRDEGFEYVHLLARYDGNGPLLDECVAWFGKERAPGSGGDPRRN